jgi:hypothetical protein
VIDTSRIVRLVVQAVPEVRPHLRGRALAFVFNIDPAYKTQDFFEDTIERLIEQVYNGRMGGEFIDIMANLIQGQITQAFRQAYEEQGYTDYILPSYLQSALESMILKQYGFVDRFYRDIIDARVDEGPIAPLLSRAPLWANRWNEAYNEATLLILKDGGGNMEWQLGATEQHCSTCEALNGIVASAREWEELGVKPQGAPNDSLECGGWRCDCSLTATNARRSPDAYGRIMAIQLAKVGL